MPADYKFWLTLFGPLVGVVLLMYLISYLRSRKTNKEAIESYGLRDAVLTKAEASFLAVLREIVGEKYQIFVKVRLADIFTTKHGEGYYAALNKVTGKHVDFLLCEPETFAPLLGIELDDKTHKKSARKKRDDFVDEVFNQVGLGLLRIPVRSTYEPVALRDKIVIALRTPNSED